MISEKTGSFNDSFRFYSGFKAPDPVIPGILPFRRNKPGDEEESEQLKELKAGGEELGGYTEV